MFGSRGQIQRLRTRSYFTKTHAASAIPMPAWMKYGFVAFLVGGVAFWTYVSVVARPEMRPVYNQSRVYIDGAWVDEWLRRREIKRLEAKMQDAIENDEPSVAAEKVLQLSRKTLYYKLMEDIKLLESAMDSSTKAEANKVPAWVKS